MHFSIFFIAIFWLSFWEKDVEKVNRGDIKVCKLIETFSKIKTFLETKTFFSQFDSEFGSL